MRWWYASLANMFLMVASLIWGSRLFVITWKGCCQLFLAALVICCFKQSVTTFRQPEHRQFSVEHVCWYHFQMSVAVDFLKSVIWAASHNPFLARRAPISQFFFGESCWMQEVLCVVIEVLKWGYYVGWRWFKIYVDKTRQHAWSHVWLLIWPWVNEIEFSHHLKTVLTSLSQFALGLTWINLSQCIWIRCCGNFWGSSCISKSTQSWVDDQEDSKVLESTRQWHGYSQKYCTCNPYLYPPFFRQIIGSIYGHQKIHFLMRKSKSATRLLNEREVSKALLCYLSLKHFWGSGKKKVTITSKLSSLNAGRKSCGDVWGISKYVICCSTHWHLWFNYWECQ